MKIQRLILQIMVYVGAFVAPVNFVGHALSAPSSPDPDVSRSSSNPNNPSPAISEKITKKIVYAKPIDFFCELKDQKDKDGNVVKKNVPTTLAQVDPVQALRQIGLSPQNNLKNSETIQPDEEKAQEVVIYYWTRNYSEAGETALMRCRRVAGVLRDIRRQDSLSLVKAGEMNGGTAICLASKQNGPCTKLIFSLTPEEQQQEATDAVLQDFLEAIRGLAVGEETIRASSGLDRIWSRIPRHWDIGRTYMVLPRLPNGVSPTRGYAVLR